MKKYNVGMIGFGFMGKAHTYAYQTIPFFYGKLPIDINLHTVCTRTPESANAAVSNFGYKNATTNLNEFFQSGVDIVHICSPIAQHKTALLQAIQQGVHIYCEKPLTFNSQEALEISSALVGKEIISQMGFHSRFYPCVIRAKEILESGKLGQPLGFHLRYFSMNRLDGSASPSALKSGPILDLGSHLFDLAFFLLGEFESLTASTTILPSNPPPNNLEDAFIAMVKMKSGAEGVVEASKIVHGSNNEYLVEINCEKGSIRFGIENPDWLYVYDANDTPGPYGGERGYKRIECFNRYPQRVFPTPRHSPGWLGGHLHSIYSFLTAIENNQAASPSLEDGIYVQVVLGLLEQSAKEKEWVKIQARHLKP